MSENTFICYIINIEMLYRKYQKKFLNKKYEMIFSNGKKISFHFYEEHFAHLVGIQIQSLKDKQLIPRNLRTNQILEFIIYKPRLFYQLVVKKGFDVKDFISPFYKQKLNVLDEINGFLPDNIEFVVEFDKEKVSSQNVFLMSDAEYLLGYKLSDEKYGVIGLIGNENGYYYPLTVLEYSKELSNDFEIILKNQKLILPLYTKISTREREKIVEAILKNREKIAAVKRYNMDFTKKYKCVTDVSEDYLKQMVYFTSKKAELEKTIGEMETENYDLQMNNIKLETENERLKAELEKLKRSLKRAGNCFDEKYEKLKMDIFDGEIIEDEIIDKAFKAFTNSERNLLEYYYGLNGKDRKSWKEIASIYEIASIQYALNKLKKDFKNICLGIKTKNPYIELLTDRQKLLSLAFTLPKEERDAFILKNGLFTCNRANNKEISEKLGIPYVKVKKIVESAEEKVRNKVYNK